MFPLFAQGSRRPCRVSPEELWTRRQAARGPNGQKCRWNEAKLGKAMYMEYYLPQDPPGKLREFAGVPAGQDVPGGLGSHRTGQAHFASDQDGNVWESDRGIPAGGQAWIHERESRKEWLTPHPKSDVHEVFGRPRWHDLMPEHAEGGVQSFLLGFNPKTEKWEHNIDLIRQRSQGTDQVDAVDRIDSKNNIYVGWKVNGGAAWQVRAGNG